MLLFLPAYAVLADDAALIIVAVSENGAVDLLAVARRYKEENIPLSAIICDYFHWTEQGDYKFDPRYWPDVDAMTKELHDMGTKLIVSVWPTINGNSENYWTMRERNLLIRTSGGMNDVFSFYGPQAEIDVTNPETRAFVFSKLKENYLDHGVDGLWFDEAEPEIHPEHFDNLLFHIGRGDEVGLLYPYYYAQMAFDGFMKMGKVPVTLIRAAYPGAQKFGALVWSGDIPSTFESLSQQVKAGLNMAMCGIPWWNPCWNAARSRSTTVFLPRRISASATGISTGINRLWSHSARLRGGAC